MLFSELFKYRQAPGPWGCKKQSEVIGKISLFFFLPFGFPPPLPTTGFLSKGESLVTLLRNWIFVTVIYPLPSLTLC